MKHYETINNESVEGFDIVASIGYEDIHPADCFDDTVDDIDEICRKIDNGIYTWFVLRVEALKNGVVLGTSYLGGNLYENPNDVITDGCYEDLKYEAITEAKETLAKLVETL